MNILAFFNRKKKGEELFEEALFYTTIFLTGAVVLALEILGARIMSVYFGSTVYVWSSLITITMAGLAFGYWIGGRISEETKICNVYLLAFYIAGLSLLFVFFFADAILSWADMFGIIWGPLVATFVLFTIPVVAFGLVSPYAVKMRTAHLKDVGGVAGSLYALSTVGSLFGGLAVGFVFAPHVAVFTMLFWSAFITLATAFLWMLFEYIVKDTKKVWYFGVLILVAVFSLSQARLSIVQLAYEPIENKVINGEIMPIFPTLFTTQGQTEAKVIYREPSAYGDIVVFDSGGESQIRCFLIDGVNETCWNFLNHVPSRYVENNGKIVLSLQEDRGAKDVLVVGVGGATLFKYLDGSGLHMDGAEINEKMYNVAEKFFVFPEDLDMNITIDDGRHFLANTDKKYDVIVMDICFVSEANVHLWTKEFYALAKEHLNEGGAIVATRGMVSANEKMEKLDHMTFNALGENFKYLYTGNRHEDTPDNFYMGLFIASDEPLEDLTILGEQYPINPWTTDSSYPTASDDKQPEMLDLVYPATEAILEQSKTNYGEEILLPL